MKVFIPWHFEHSPTDQMMAFFCAQITVTNVANVFTDPHYKNTPYHLNGHGKPLLENGPHLKAQMWVHLYLTCHQGYDESYEDSGMQTVNETVPGRSLWVKCWVLPLTQSTDSMQLNPQSDFHSNRMRSIEFCIKSMRMINDLLFLPRISHLQWWIFMWEKPLVGRLCLMLKDWRTRQDNEGKDGWNKDF